MKILYSYITVASEGDKVHIDSFVKAYQSLGETVIENGFLVEPYRGGKESWSLIKRLIIKLQWVTGNITYFWRTLCMAWRHKPDVLLFRFQPLHEFVVSIVGLSFFYSVVLEINAVRSLELHAGRPRISDGLDRLSLSRARRSFGVSRRVREHLLDHYPIAAHRVTVIENGVDVDKFNPQIVTSDFRKMLNIGNRFVVGFIGNFRPWHGINSIISMAEVIVPHLQEALFLMVGDGGERQLYEEQVKKKSLSAHFIFTGRVTHADVPQYLAAMDVVLAPIAKGSFSGEFHGSPLKIFEYMAMAKPVIASPLGQICEVIEDSVSGLLIDFEDTPKLTQAILNLHHHRALSGQMGLNARARVMERYTWRINAEKVRCLCSEACHGR